MLSNEDISDILNREVSSAQARLADARGTVDAIITEAPGMLPHPDGLHRLTNAIKEHNKAREVLARALERSTAFTFHGVVPDDLK